jgi:hypothetical protein
MIAALLIAVGAASAPVDTSDSLLPPPLYDEAGRWHPSIAYVLAGQDEAGYRSWVLASAQHAAQVSAFNNYLTTYGVGGVVPTWQLIRTASDWQKCGDQPFEVPPSTHWPNIVAALRYIGAYIEPVIGQVEVVSGYRNPSLNVCARGAATSTHLTGGAIDMVPLTQTTREALMEALCRIQLADGGWNNIGLGFYKGVRFHIDARKTREWGTAGKAGGWGCKAVLAEGALPYVAPVAATSPSAVSIPAPR